MKPVYQTYFGDGSNGAIPGNCMQAAVASLLELSLEYVPHFTKDMPSWSASYLALQHWLDQWDYGLLTINGEPACYGEGWAPCHGLLHQFQYYLVSGKSPRGLGHMCVGQQGVIVHDPHPDGGGLVSIQDYTLLVPLQPRI